MILGVASTTTLRKHVTDMEAGTLARFEASAQTHKVRRFTQFYDGAASWSRAERIIARVEVGAQGADTRFIVTNLAGGRPRRSARISTVGAARPRTTSNPGRRIWPPDRTSCTRATANQFCLVPACRCLLADMGPAC
ncbi:transposase [Phyllobacterium salinisoli]|uniref:transposase n=1 Tax=Phyllobacterium salinisoli TaxID=1899321 RepID=UPI00247904F6|nr:transposase [Phyllobacterium salinisoli]